MHSLVKDYLKTELSLKFIVSNQNLLIDTFFIFSLLSSRRKEFSKGAIYIALQ